METVLYADVLFLVNFAMDFISLSAAATLASVSKKPLRLCIASALGAVYGVAATASGMEGALQYILASAVGASMCLIGYGLCPIITFLRRYLIFWGCGALLGGIMTAVLSMGSIPFRRSYLLSLIPGACTVLFFTVRAIRARSSCESVKITVTCRGRTLSLDALCDSGNFLCDPFSGRPVVIVSGRLLAGILTARELEAFLTCDAEYLSKKGMMPRLIPRKSEDGSRILCAFSPEKATVSAKGRSINRDILIAPSPHAVTHYAGFPATAPSVIAP